MKSSKMIPGMVLCCVALPSTTLMSPPARADYPTCASASSDPDGDGWGWENNQSCKVVATSTTTYPTCASASSDPDGDGWGWENNQSCKVASTSSGSTSTAGQMYVSGSYLYSASGHVFLPRGINLQYGDDPSSALTSIAPIASTGANLVRLELRSNTSAAALRSALDAIVAKGMVAMPMYWDASVTCQSDASAITSAVNNLWLGTWKSVMQDSKYKGKILLNIANEWGEDTSNYASYLATYKTLIGALRRGGYTMPLVVDGAHCGQYANSFLNGNAATLQAADPLKNLLFSVHAYHWLWDTHAEIDANIAQLKSAGVPFIFGEFGDYHFQAPYNVDHYYLLTKTQSEAIGWIAWSWKGNGSGAEQVLDMSYDYGSVNLSQHGSDIVNGEAGIKQTSVLLK